MDERIEKAFSVANYMSTLSNQRRILLEEFNQKLIYYKNGGTFKITPDLITFTKSIIEMGHDTDVPLIDTENKPLSTALLFSKILSSYKRKLKSENLLR